METRNDGSQLPWFFQDSPRGGLAGLTYTCSNMWSNYLKVASEMAGHTIQVLDRFHIMKKFNEKINEVRAQEVGQLKEDGYEPVLKNSRWCLLKRPENLTDKQTVTGR